MYILMKRNAEAKRFMSKSKSPGTEVVKLQRKLLVWTNILIPTLSSHLSLTLLLCCPSLHLPFCTELGWSPYSNIQIILQFSRLFIWISILSKCHFKCASHIKIQQGCAPASLTTVLIFACLHLQLPYFLSYPSDNLAIAGIFWSSSHLERLLYTIIPCDLCFSLYRQLCYISHPHAFFSNL